MVADRDSLRDDSAPSRASRSTTSLPPLEDAGARDRSPRRLNRLRDSSDRAGSFGPHRSRDNRGRSPLQIANHRDRNTQDSSSRGRLTNASAGADDRMVPFDENILEEDLSDAFDEDTVAGEVVSSHFGSGSWAPTRVDALSPPSGSAQAFGPPAAQVMAAQCNSDSSVTHQVVASSDQRSVTINQGFYHRGGRIPGCT